MKQHENQHSHNKESTLGVGSEPNEKSRMKIPEVKLESRPLSYMEKFATGWGTQNIHFTFSGAFTESLITEAVRQVRVSNPLLRCVIQDLKLIVHSPSDSQLQALPIACHRIHQGAQARFASAAQHAWKGMAINMVPEKLWEMHFFYDDTGCDMVLRTHHSILDGMSWFSLIQDFLQVCEGKPLEVRPLNPPMELVYPAHATAITGQEPFALHDWLNRRGTEPQAQPIFTHNVLTRLPTKVLEKLKLRCRERGVTVHGALMASFLLATDNALPKLYSDISTRRFCEPPLSATSPGVYIGQIVWETSAIPNAGFWENAARLMAELRERIAAGVHLASNEECSSTSVKPKILNITNMAPPEFPSGKFSLKWASLFFATGHTPEIPSFPVVFSIMTINGTCNLQFNYHQNFWSRPQAECILRKLAQILTVEGAGLLEETMEILFQPL